MIAHARKNPARLTTLPGRDRGIGKRVTTGRWSVSG